jgi:hypothetical protein
MTCTASHPDRLDCFYKSVLVASTGGLVSGTGTLQWTYDPAPGDALWCLIVMSTPNSKQRDGMDLYEDVSDLANAPCKALPWPGFTLMREQRGRRSRPVSWWRAPDMVRS